ncbi:phenylalanine--tRNA ligase subunit beta [Candidatus Uhrbacteria bacterium]|nr:phenylalanine--tRNA ligase subunit beta [Candidatus Uhrbacteria bacterium]
MLVSKKWLQEFVELPEDLSDEELARRITLSTVEVEEISSQAAPLERIVVGVLLAVEAHPNADKLRVCRVDAGQGEPLQIVCGGTNLLAGMKVAVALVGARVKWHGEGELVEIKLTKLRDVESFGMICAANEIGTATGNEGEREIVDLSGWDAPPGTPLAEVLGLDDVVFDVDNKSLTNRPDLFSHRGMGREVGALLGTTFKDRRPPVVSEETEYEVLVNVTDIAACPRYMGVVLDGIRIETSPEWMQKRLRAVGVRPVNIVVDVTNYVMLEIGQSLHAFDAAKLENVLSKPRTIEIEVRPAVSGERFVTLDDTERELGPSDLVIRDAKKAVALAGVMGGHNSEIGEETTTVFLESANFHPSWIRKTSQRLGLRSEASLRYEKGLDPNLSDLALRRAVELLLELVPGARVASPVVDVGRFELKQGPIPFSLERLDQKLGVNIPVDTAIGILERLGFGLKQDGEAYLVTIPSWRATKDISIFEDLVEEVARIYGYERIPPTLPRMDLRPPTPDPMRVLERRVRSILAERFAATETYNYSFTSPATLAYLGEDAARYIQLANPISKERPYVARTLVPNLLENVEKNQRQTDTVRLFEVARTYVPEIPGDENGEGGSPLPHQDHVLGLVFAKKGDIFPFRELKRLCAGALRALGYTPTFLPMSDLASWMHPGRSAAITVDGEAVGYLAEVLPQRATDLGIEAKVAVGEVNLSLLAAFPARELTYHPIPPFPSVKRDLAFVVNKDVTYTDLELAMHAAAPLLVDVELFDTYAGKGIPEGKKSLALHLEFRADDQTLSSEEVDACMESLRQVLTARFSATMR